MDGIGLADLLAARAGEEFGLHARTINPQFVRMLRTIGFDRSWARGEGAYLYDRDGNRFLDMLGGFGMYNVGRSNERVRGAHALVGATDVVHPEAAQHVEEPVPVAVVEIGALTPRPVAVESDRPQHPDELRVDRARVKVELFARPRGEKIREADAVHRERL